MDIIGRKRVAGLQGGNYRSRHSSLPPSSTTKLDNYYDAQVSLDTSRDSVSAVDFNDEAMNLMMYAKAYNAACRLMTTIDSVLDKLINNTGMTT